MIDLRQAKPGHIVRHEEGALGIIYEHVWQGDFRLEVFMTKGRGVLGRPLDQVAGELEPINILVELKGGAVTATYIDSHEVRVKLANQFALTSNQRRRLFLTLENEGAWEYGDPTAEGAVLYKLVVLPLSQ